MGSFVYKCLAVKDLKKPLRSRCRKKVGDVGVLCKDCLERAKKETIHVLMHREVTENYGIKFNNQVTVPLFLGTAAEKPESKFQIDERKRDSKRKLLEEFRGIDGKELKEMWKILKLGKWNAEKFKGEYKIHYFASKEIINKLIEMSE